MLSDKRILTHFDFITPIIAISILILSNYLLREVNEASANRQIIYFVICLVLFAIIFMLPIKKLTWLIPIVYWLGILSLILVKYYGVSKFGAQRWLNVPFINIALQPSEIFKPIMILMLAHNIYKSPPPKNGYGIKRFIVLSFYILLPIGLIMQQPDLGTSLVLLFVCIGILFLVGVQARIWVILILGIGLASPFLYNSLYDYQKKRIKEFLKKDPSYHVQQSIIAIGSGGFIGKSKVHATQTKFKFLPVASSDFIFSYYLERFGFLGGVLLILALAIIILHLTSLGFSDKHDYYVKVVSIGIGLMIFLSMSINILMITGLAPVVGLPFPFLSYGGSNLIGLVFLIAVLENLLAFRYKF